jgi:DNA recombination protein RmuC
MLSVVIGLAAFLVGLFVGLVVWHRAKSNADAERSDLKLQVNTLTAERKSDQEKLKWVETAQESMRDAFNALAGEALKSNAEALTAEAKKDIASVVDPLKDNLTSLDTHVRALEQARTGAYKSIEQQLSQLRETHSKLQESTVSLTQALRSPTVRGRWGEIQLRRVVEMAGMEKHVAFDEQATTDSGRPDMIAYLPNGGILPVDAKVPLDAYLSAMESQDEQTRSHHMTLHAKAIRSRVNELGQKRYWDQFDSAPDFVVMFVPNEACLGGAFEKDTGLLEHAIDKHVLISSPVTLLALLRAVAFGWQQHQVTENAVRIAQEGRDLYARLKTFTGHIASVGGSLGKTVEWYNKAVGSFDHRLMPSARHFQELGVSDEEIEAPERIEIAPAFPKDSPPAPEESD